MLDYATFRLNHKLETCQAGRQGAGEACMANSAATYLLYLQSVLLHSTFPEASTTS